MYFIGIPFDRNVLSFFFFFKQKTAYEMRISDWSSDVCSSDLMANAKGEDKTVEADGATLLDGTHQVVHRGVAVAVFLAQVGGMLLRQPEDVGRLADPAPVVEGGDLLLADALDVEGIARDEMAPALHGLGRAADHAAAASPHILRAAGIRLPHRPLTAHRHFGRDAEGSGLFRPALPPPTQ